MAAGTNPVGTRVDLDRETMAPEEYIQGVDNNDAVARRIVGPFAPHETYEGSPSALGMKVTVDAGYIRSGATLTEVASQATADFVAPVSNPRIDRIVGDVSTGAISVVAGSEAASPSAPAIPTGKFPIAQVALTVGMTAITNQAITDERALWLTAVDTADIVDGAVTTAKIETGAVTEASLADGVAVHVDSDGGSPAVFPALRMKVLEIGDWNMDATNGISVTHGMTVGKMRHISALIRSDNNGTFVPVTPTLSSAAGYGVRINGADTTGITLDREAGGSFDNNNYDSTGYNRGWITILYDENG